MDENIVIKVKDLTKVYKLYNAPIDRMKEALHPLKKSYHKDFYALNNISFEIRKGETVGIVGKNGSGKSTLLKIITGVLSPTSGEVAVNGRVSALLELGAGFNPEYTGLENIYFQGNLMGYSREEMEEKIQKILDFADIGDFIFQPVKSYSSGMFSRLAFAVAINVEPDILIVDEALSVGDHFFQAKCYACFKKMMANGCTILFVSHSAAIVKSMCDNAILLNNGILDLHDTPDKVFDRYFAINATSINADKIIVENDNEAESSPKDEIITHSTLQPMFNKRINERVGSGIASFLDCLLLVNNKEVTVVTTDDICVVRAIIKATEDCHDEGEIGIVVSTLEGIELFAINSFFLDQVCQPLTAGKTYLVDFTFKLPLSVGKYRVDLGYRLPIQGEYVDKIMCALTFEVINKPRAIVPLLINVPGSIDIQELRI